MEVKATIIKGYKCKECGHYEPAETMKGTMIYTEFDDEICKDWEPLCPNCDAEGDDHFDIIEE